MAFAFTALQCCAIVVQTDYTCGNFPEPPKNKGLKSDLSRDNSAYWNDRNFTSDLGRKLVEEKTESCGEKFRRTKVFSEVTVCCLFNIANSLTVRFQMSFERSLSY